MDSEMARYLLKQGRASLQCFEQLSEALRRTHSNKKQSFVLIVNGLPDQKTTQSFKDFIQQRRVIEDFISQTISLLESMMSQVTPRTAVKQGLFGKQVAPRLRENQATQTTDALPPRLDSFRKTKGQQQLSSSSPRYNPQQITSTSRSDLAQSMMSLHVRRGSAPSVKRHNKETSTGTQTQKG